MPIAANRYTTTEYLYPHVKRIGHIPPAQTPYLEADIYAIADAELRTAIMRQVRNVRENYYAANVLYTAANPSSVYDIPARAIGMSLNDIWLESGTSITQVVRTETNEQISTVSSPTGFYSAHIAGNQVKIRPLVSGANVRFLYMQRPNTLVPTSACAQVIAIDGTNTILTFSSMPATFVTGLTYDCVQDQPGFNWRFIDLIPTAVGASTMTFASLPLDAYGVPLIQVGDWVSLAGQSCVIQMPVEMLPLLVQRTVVKYYESQNYKDKADLAQKKLESMEKDIMSLISPRIQYEPKRIIADTSVIAGYRRGRSWQAT